MKETNKKTRKNIKERLKLTTLGFTLVELLAVIVILAIILVIAVPKVMSVIEDSKKATLESTVKMIATEAEKARVQNTLLGNDKGINCKDIVQINEIDYERCIIEFDNDTAKVTIKGSGKFDNLYVCDGDKTSAIAINQDCEVEYSIASTYIEKLEAFNGSENSLEKKRAEYEGTTYDAGIRYVGAMSDVKNKVYYNCDDKDTNGVSYGENNYDYAGSCEVWRIIGVFDVDNGDGKVEKRVKIINTASTFQASWDSSASGTNSGWGINQWGESTYSDGARYEGADLMQLLNGYYIGRSQTCGYNVDGSQSDFGQTCTTESLTTAKIKPLTNNALNIIEETLWYTYATDVRGSSIAYLQERGITKKYTGCLDTEISKCESDGVIRDNEWVGLVGLMSVSDITYANGWLYNDAIVPWSISPHAYSSNSVYVWANMRDYSVRNQKGVWPTVYLKSNVQIIGGDGSMVPYKLSV